MSDLDAPPPAEKLITFAKDLIVGVAEECIDDTSGWEEAGPKPKILPPTLEYLGERSGVHHHLLERKPQNEGFPPPYDIGGDTAAETAATQPIVI